MLRSTCALVCLQVTAKTESENAKPIIDYFGLDKSKSEPQVHLMIVRLWLGSVTLVEQHKSC